MSNTELARAIIEAAIRSRAAWAARTAARANGNLHGWQEGDTYWESLDLQYRGELALLTRLGGDTHRFTHFVQGLAREEYGREAVDLIHQPAPILIQLPRQRARAMQEVAYA